MIRIYIIYCLLVYVTSEFIKTDLKDIDIDDVNLYIYNISKTNISNCVNNSQACYELKSEYESVYTYINLEYLNIRLDKIDSRNNTLETMNEIGIFTELYQYFADIFNNYFDSHIRVRRSYTQGIKYVLPNKDIVLYGQKYFSFSHEFYIYFKLSLN